ncbi:MAG: alpha-2-macroglobulin family protein [Pirellulales bacterium]
MELIIRATDAVGKPQSAELSVALVEESLLKLFGSNVQSFNGAYMGVWRTSAMRSGSSISFSYRPQSHAIDKQLLAELERREIEADEETRRAAGIPFGIVMESDAEAAGVAGESLNTGVVAGTLRIDNLAADPNSPAGEPQMSQVQLYSQSSMGRNPNSRYANPNGFVSNGYFGANAMNQDGSVAQGGGGLGVNAGQRSWNDSDDSFTVTGASTLQLGESNSLAFNSATNFAAIQTLNGGQSINANAFFCESNGGNLSVLNLSGQRDCVMVNPTNGEQWNFNYRNTFGRKFDVALADEVGKKLSASGNLVLAQVGPQETGYWNPLIVTDASGVATLKITMPEQSTAWKLTARGVTKDSLAGEAEDSLIVKQDLFGELKLPAVFTDGDEVEVQALIHNDLIDKGTIEVAFRTIIAGKLIEEKKTLNVTSKGIHELTFRTTIKRPTEVDANNVKDQKVDFNSDVPAMFELSIKSGDNEDLLRRAVPIQPYGVPVYAVQGGHATGDTTVWIEPPTGIDWKRPRLQLVLGSSVDRGLLDILLGPSLSCGIDSVRTASGLDAATGDLMAAVALQKLFDKTRDAGTAQAQAIDTRIRSAIGQIVAAQRDDGAWSWSGYGQQSHRFTTARVYWALTLAVKSGYKISEESLTKARAYLQTQLAAIDETDFETRTVLLHALSVSGHGDFAQANRLHRNKASLSPTALVYAALAFAEMDRKPVANELLAALPNEAVLVDLPTRRGSARGILPWSASGIELKALEAVALAKIAPEDAKLKRLVDDLMAARRGHRWTPEKATGPAALAVCDWFARARFENETYTIKLFVNDLQVDEMTIEKDAETRTIDVPDRMLKPGKNRINLQLTGRGRYTFQAILAGFVPAEKLKNTTKEWTVVRRYEPAPRELDGREIPRGFDVLAGSYTTFRNPLTQLPVGKRGHVTLDVSRHNVPQNTPDEQLDYLVVTEPLPSGVSVVEQSIRGGFERYELGAGSITFYVGSRRYVETITYDIHGYLPGSYRDSPTIVRNAYRLDDLAVAPAVPLTVLAADQESKDAYKETPRELFEFGKRYFEKQDYKAATSYLTNLFKDWTLNADTYRQTVEMLFDAHLSLGPAGETVRYFEIIKERFPDKEIPFDKIMKVAAAYDGLGEYERSYMVYRAILENSFLRENGVAGYLEQQGEFLRSVEVMQRLLAEYPPEPYAATTLYSLAQRVYEYAPHAAGDTKLREKKINKVVLIQQALGMLDNFLTLYPDDPAADQAAFSLSNALLELKAYKELIARATKYASRYAGSDFLDSYWYLVAYGHFALQEHEEALKMARKVADSKRVDKATGREIESPNKWQAVYILGQVYHSLGRAGEAVNEYLRVEDRFADAKEAIAYFLRKEIKLPEVVSLKPGEPVAAELTFRNIPRVDIKVYRIDLMKFSLLKRNLSGITSINLSGIRPTHEETIELGDGKDYRDRVKKIELPFKEEGAYLLVCRGESLHASGLILISPLTVDVQEESGEGRVRVTVKDVVNDKYLARVQAKVIGSRNGEFISGVSDLRGVFIADGVKGTSTVIAQADDGRYAFFRGTRELGPPPAPANAPPAQSPGKDAGKENDLKEQKEGELLQELQRGNKALQLRQRGVLDNNYKMNNDGVKAKSAF